MFRFAEPPLSIAAALPSREGELADAAVACLTATLHSPDLDRWIAAHDRGGGALEPLAAIKLRVLEIEQHLGLLRRGWRVADLFDPESEAETVKEALREAVILSPRQIEEVAVMSRELRSAFREERARLAREDLSFAAAFDSPTPQTLRLVAGYAAGDALLCLFEIGEGDKRRTVGALLHRNTQRRQLLELPGLFELAWHANQFAPEFGERRRGALRGTSPAGVRAAPVGVIAPVPGFTELLAERMSRAFWAPLQQAPHESGVAIERLHVCLHGTAQQLPLALRQPEDCPGVQVVPWPGLPYLRRAATAAKGAVVAASDDSSPWLVGHDCAWASEQPLPMVAVEAALLRQLLRDHGQAVHSVERAAALDRRARALVACCHGGAEQAQFDHALHLGQEPLTVRQILQDNIGPPLALLPACHAGRTDEDAAGNALGVAAAFMLSGTKVVCASSKAVPDLLQPWLSTLAVWHAMQGLPHHEAATLACEQFARLAFPKGYRRWLQQALPQALATIQPGGEEDRHICGLQAQIALEVVQARWPWEGETKHLFGADRPKREEATRSVVQGVLRPRGGEAGARALEAEAREMAAFVFVYGVDDHSAS